jgi:hypothetical protein
MRCRRGDRSGLAVLALAAVVGVVGVSASACRGQASEAPASVQGAGSTPGSIDVVVQPVQGAQPLRGLELTVTYDPAALTIQGVGPGPDNALLDTVIDNHTAASAASGRFTVLATDTRKLAIGGGSAVRIAYAERHAGTTHVDLGNVTLVTADGVRTVVPGGGVDLTLP